MGLALGRLGGGDEQGQLVALRLRVEQLATSRALRRLRLGHERTPLGPGLGGGNRAGPFYELVLCWVEPGTLPPPAPSGLNAAGRSDGVRLTVRTVCTWASSPLTPTLVNPAAAASRSKHQRLRRGIVRPPCVGGRSVDAERANNQDSGGCQLRVVGSLFVRRAVSGPRCKWADPGKGANLQIPPA